MPWTYTITNATTLTQTSTRNRDTTRGASFAARTRGHAPHLSISDDSHHVTETIGFLYGDDDERDRRRVSNAPSTARSSLYSERSPDEEMSSPQRTSFSRKLMPENNAHAPPPRHFEPSNGQQRPHPVRSYSFESLNGQQPSPVMAARDQSPSDTAQAHFPLNDIDYESSPAAVAQELSNLQALRRMSMDVHAAGDPDLPSLNPADIPSQPSPTASDDDSARLFWVPARIHPELAPKEFKTFLESKADQIKRRSGDLSTLGSSSLSSRSTSISSNSSGLARKKSMLSREVNNSSGYRDGADILQRKRSMSQRRQPSDPNLAELETLVANNLQVQRPDSPDDNVDFILPSVPSSSLKRSTKTRYQRVGSGTRGRGDRPQRGLKRAQTPDLEPNAGDASPVPDTPIQFPSFASAESGRLADTLSFPAAKAGQNAQNFSRPGRSPSPPQDAAPTASPSTTFHSILTSPGTDRLNTPSAPEQRSYRTHMTQSDRQSVPQIIETPPVEEQVVPKLSTEVVQPSEQPHPLLRPVQQQHPARTSSRESPKPQGRPPMPRTQSSASVVPGKNPRADVPPLTSPKQSLDQPSPLPGNDTNTANLSFIPTLTVDKQSQEKKESKKSGWGWLLGKDEDKEKGKGRPGKNTQSYDNTRLDVLQSSIDGSSRRRETIEIDRDSLRLEEERKKESQRKASPNEKKEKDSIFSSLFGGKKSKAEKEAKKSSRGLSPEPRHRELKPDIDYSWTRFSILEERAIYRMAHIKLANPRRALYSQVLLSNFMYSYLAKVQQMHPQMNLPTSAKQQKKQKEQPQPTPQPQQQGQKSDEFSTYQRYQQVCIFLSTVLDSY